AAPELAQPVSRDVQVGVLVERVEGDPQSEALGKRDFLLHRFGGMNLIAEVPGLEIFLHVLGHKMTPIRRRVDEEILGSRCDRTRSEEHTSELQSPYDLVCRLLLEKKKI